MKHWASALIGLPWEQGGKGPHSFSCWGLIQHVYSERRGMTLPDITVDDPNIRELVAIKRVTEQHRLFTTGRADDLVIMRGRDGCRHVGVLIETAQGLRLLHSSKGQGVRADRLRQATADGYEDFEFWRPECTPTA